MHCGVLTLNQCLEAAVRWLRLNQLNMNPNKIEVKLVGKSDALVVLDHLVMEGMKLDLQSKLRPWGEGNTSRLTI